MKTPAQLIAETREDDARMEDAPWVVDSDDADEIRVIAWAGRYTVSCDLSPDDAAGATRLRNNARALADQLEAQGKELEFLSIRRENTKNELACIHAMHLQAVTARDQLRAEVERLTAECDFGDRTAAEQVKHSGKLQANLTAARRDRTADECKHVEQVLRQEIDREIQSNDGATPGGALFAHVVAKRVAERLKPE